MDENYISQFSDRPYLTSLGLAVIDEIRFGDGTMANDVLGGSGSFCTAGARLFLDDSTARSVAWRIHTGNDFPEIIEKRLLEWNIDLTIHRANGGSCTRGQLVYADNTFGRKYTSDMMRGSNTDADTAKTFRYTTAVREVNPADFRGTRLLHSRCFHLLASPSDAISQVDELRDTICRSRKGKGQEQPLVIWEPAPPSCLPKNLALCFEAARMVDIFSPNHIELQAFFGLEDQPFNKAATEYLAIAILNSGVGAT
jgi:hypothetical protein